MGFNLAFKGLMPLKYKTFCHCQYDKTSSSQAVGWITFSGTSEYCASTLVFGKGLEPDTTEELCDDMSNEQKQSDSNRLLN
jgi:hypothetical protein